MNNKKLKTALDTFIENNSEEVQNEESKEKFVKSDFTIIERLDKIIIAENGKQLLREVY